MGNRHRRRLGLDSGYISRVLRSLERHKLVRVRASGSDRRVRHVTLTRSGLAERAELDRLADTLASRLLAPLNDGQRARLLSAMTDIERLIEASMVKFAIEDPGSADARSCLDRYFAELDTRFEEGFDPSLSLPVGAEELTPPAGAFVIARLRGRPVGCGAVKCQPRASAHVRRMWVSPEARGLGVGRRLLREFEQFARASGASVIRLDTHRSLTEAIALYRREGYREVSPFSGERYGDHWFEKRLDARGHRARGSRLTERAPS